MVLPPNVDFSEQQNLLRARFRGPFKGLNTTSGLSDMDFSALRIARNLNLEDNGTLSNRKGTKALLGTPWGSRRIHQGLTFTNTSGDKLIIAGRESGNNTGALGVVASNFSSVTNISTGLNNRRPSLISIKGRLLYFNGFNDFLYDGTGGSNPDEVRQIGITPPVGAPTLASTANGNLVVGASYLVAYTYYNDNTKEESSASPISAPLTIAADPNDGITVTYVDGDANTATHVNFYRTFAGEPILFFDKSVAVGAGTSTTLIQADAGLGRELELDHTRPGVYGFFPYAWQGENRVFITGRDPLRNRVQISAITSTGPHPEAYPAKNFVDCESQKGLKDYNLGGGMAGDAVVVLKTESVGRVEKIGADDSTRADDPVIFNYREISRDVNAVSAYAACNVFGEYLWLGRDNVYSTDGVRPRRLADSIRQELLDMNLSISDDYSAHNDPWHQRVMFTVRSETTKTAPDWVLVGKYHNYPEFEWSIYTPADDNSSVESGIQAGCFFDTSLLANEENIIFGAYDFSGKIYQMNTGLKDAETHSITIEVEFAPITYGLDEEEKLFIQDYITFIGGISAQDVSAFSKYNYSQTKVEPQLLKILGSGVAVWGGSTWGGTNWASALRVTTQVPHFCHRKAFTKQLNLKWNATDFVTILNYQTMARPTFWRG